MEVWGYGGRRHGDTDVGDRKVCGLVHAKSDAMEVGVLAVRVECAV